MKSQRLKGTWTDRSVKSREEREEREMKLRPLQRMTMGGAPWRFSGVVLSVALAAAGCVALATRGGARSSELVPQPWLEQDGALNDNTGSAGARRKHETLKYDATKAGASQEWLHYSLHHSGALQQERRDLLGRAAASQKLVVAVPAGSAGHKREKRASASKKGFIETSGNFRGDDDSLFGENTFDEAQASPGQPMPYQEGPCHNDDGHEIACAGNTGNHCVDEKGSAVPCEEDDGDSYCVDDNGNDVECDDEPGPEPEPEPEPQKPAEPSDFLKGIVKAVSAGKHI